MTESRRDLSLGGGLALVFLLLYFATLCYSVFWYDSAEYAAAALTLGIPHPPGYPLYTLIAHVFTWLPVEPAVAVNAMSAVFGAVAVGLLFALLRAWGVTRTGAVVGAATLGASALFWSQALIAEVHTPALSVLFAVLLLLTRGVKRNRLRPIMGAAALAGLGLGIHYSIATCGLGFALIVFGVGLDIRAPRDLAKLVTGGGWRRRLSAGALAGLGALLGSCIFLYLPLRASMNPVINFGNPSTWKGFKWCITGGQYPGFFHNPPFGDRAAEIASSFYGQLTWLGLVLALVGIVAAFRRVPLYAAGLVLCIVGNLAFFFDYTVHDWNVFLLATTASLCAFVGFGADAFIATVHRAVGAEQRVRLSRLARVLVLAVPLLMVVRNYRDVDMSDFHEAEDWADDVVEQLPRGAVVMDFSTPPEWMYHAVFGFYYRIALHERPDVTLLSMVGPGALARMVAGGRDVYMYTPVPRVVFGSFIVEKVGRLYKVVGLKPRSKQ